MALSPQELCRYARQLLVDDVGQAGQERLAAAELTARSRVEALYLAAAGVGGLHVPSLEIAQAVTDLNPSVRAQVGAAAAEDDVEAASLAALAKLREVLRF